MWRHTRITSNSARPIEQTETEIDKNLIIPIVSRRRRTETFTLNNNKNRNQSYIQYQTFSHRFQNNFNGWA